MNHLLFKGVINVDKMASLYNTSSARTMWIYDNVPANIQLYTLFQTLININRSI